jgi:hypothetical protein
MTTQAGTPPLPEPSGGTAVTTNGGPTRGRPIDLGALLEPTEFEATNQLNAKVVIEAADGSRLAFAPLETQDVDQAKIDRFALRHWDEKIVVKDKPKTDRSFEGIWAAIGFGMFFAFVWAILSAIVGAPDWWIYGWFAVALFVIIGGIADSFRNRGSRGETFARAFVTWVRSEGGQQLYLFLGLLIGFALPTAAIFFTADVAGLIDALRAKGLNQGHAELLTLIGRVMQVIFVSAASLTPALLFFIFDREHLGTLRDRFMRQIMRFDPTVKTQADVHAKYGHVIDEAYGRDVDGRILPGRRSPLLLATLLFALGWTFTLLHGDVTILDERGITALFEPRQSAVTFAFLGAYFYGLNVVLRGYVRKDLRAKTYSTLAVRVLVVVVLAWVLEFFWSGTTLYVAAFLAGIVPETALTFIKETARTRRGIRMAAAGDETDPLTNLEGIDLYDLARLFDEGVTSIQGLANDDIVELMLQTRISVPRILDWLDQAILYLHAGSSTDDERKTTLTKLRSYGIRTATDLEDVLDAAKASDTLATFDGILGPSDTGPPRTEVIRQSMTDAEWMVNLRYWRKQESMVPPTEECKVADLNAARLNLAAT